MSESGEDDVYSAETVIRDATREELDAIRETQKSSEKRRAAEQKDTPKEERAVSDEAKETETNDASPEDAAKPPSEKPAKPTSKAEAKFAEKKATATTSSHPPAPLKAVAPPVTLGELMIAFAAAVALIVVGFYVIAGAL